MKKGKEIKLKLPYQYNVIGGTIDNKNPKSLYIQISAWGKPKDNLIEDYEPLLRIKSKRVKRKLNEVLDDNTFHKSNTIVDFNMASSGISYDKKSYMSVEVTLFKKEPFYPVNSTEMEPILSHISEKIISDVFECDEHFEFYLRKK